MLFPPEASQHDLYRQGLYQAFQITVPALMWLAFCLDPKQNWILEGKMGFLVFLAKILKNIKV